MFVKKYDSGLTVVVETMSALRSVSCGIMVGTGSAYETPETSGISHFIEHMLFKGTAKRSAEDIVGAFDAVGASYNAYTSKENTCFYFKSIDEKVEDCFEILSDMFFGSIYATEELDRERHVILEEINMSFDEPDGVCNDVLYRTAYSGSLGMEILGSKANVSRFGKADILKYRSTHYLPSDTVVGFAGNIEPAAAVALVDKYMAQFAAAEYAPPPVVTEQKFKPGYGEYIKDYEQSELAIAFPSMRFGDDRAPALSALDYIFGSSMSSRLFQRLRERMGLAYSICTLPWLGKSGGMFAICANVNVANIEKSVKAIREETDRLLAHGVTDDETEKAKMQLKVSALFSKENPLGYMTAIMRRRLYTDDDYDIDELISEIDKVTAKDINALAHEILTERAAMAYAGKKPPRSIESIYYGK